MRGLLPAPPQAVRGKKAIAPLPYAPALAAEGADAIEVELVLEIVVEVEGGKSDAWKGSPHLSIDCSESGLGIAPEDIYLCM